jgi:tripartite ATP-independent transporter DctM subunit
MSVAGWTMFVLFFLWSFLGMPIGYAMLASGIVYLMMTHQDLALVATQSLNGLYGSFVLLSVPLFILAAEIMNAGQLTEKMYGVANMLVGRYKGGLAHVNIVASVIFSGMSGSAMADAAGPGKLEVDAMVKTGYAPGFAAALSSTSAIIGPIIPPSIPMVLYGAVADTSIGYLFMGGVIPGLMLAAAQSGVVAVMARYKDFPVAPVLTLGQSMREVGHAIPVLCLPAILLGGIYSGAVTPTEAAAVAAFCALLLAVFWYRTLNYSAFYQVLINSSKATTIVAITIAGALVMNWIVAAEQIPKMLGLWIIELDLTPALFMFAVTVLFLVLGAFLDTLLMLLIIIPILMPTVISLGIDPVHFGVVSVVNLMIGLVTPPMGALVFLIAGVSGIRVVDITKELWPFLIVLIALLFVLVYVPQLTLWLPETMGYQVQGDFMR